MIPVKHVIITNQYLQANNESPEIITVSSNIAVRFEFSQTSTFWKMLVKNNIKKCIYFQRNNKTFQEIKKPSSPLWTIFSNIADETGFSLKNQALFLLFADHSPNLMENSNKILKAIFRCVINITKYKREFQRPFQ